MSKPQLITLTDPRSPAAEAYRTLRTNLTFAGLDHPIETLVVTSPAPGEGKSVAAANLAVTMAQGEHRTILVDADLRRPVLHEIFGVSNERGLTTMFVDPQARANPPLVEVGVENLWLLPSGPLPPTRPTCWAPAGWRKLSPSCAPGPTFFSLTPHRSLRSPTRQCWG